ncbi:SKP1-like protein 1B [Carex littledalei]|uniref:SKP1-like protein n=1 Tax=Carex littledalei TaxID=544730 RepID=A0A833RF68_9POAL|nr:SKP1-like protein 1B [Carex littledalei]
MSDITASNMVTLKTSDGMEFEVSLTVAKQSKAISRTIEDTSTEHPIPLPNVTERILKKVIKYCEKHVEAADESKTVTVTEEGSSTSQASPRISEEELRNWDTQFVNVDMQMLFDLIMAADYLEIKGLLDATCQKVADMMAGKSPEEIRQTFNIKNDYTPKEEEEVQHEHKWAFA